MVKLWSKHWVTFRSRHISSHRQETPFLALSIEQGTLGEREIPVDTSPEFRHYMSNIFIYLMPPCEEVEKVGDSYTKKGLVHGWELKLGMPIEEAKSFVKELQAIIEACETRRKERHKRQDEKLLVGEEKL